MKKKNELTDKRFEEAESSQTLNNLGLALLLMLVLYTLFGNY
jgi:hypothetical protein